MARGQPSSFDRVFRQEPRDETEKPPSMHELFNANMRGDLDLQGFARALAQLHGMRMTPAAIRIMSSVDATSGQLSFQLFSKAMQDDTMHMGGAGSPMVITDQAAAIISDNSGLPAPKKPPSQCAAARPSTDISLDPFIKQQVRLERAQAKAQARGPGTMPGNPVLQTNNTSAGNPFAGPNSYANQAAEAQADEAYGSREMASSATRMFVGGELSRRDYENFLTQVGVSLGNDSELRKLICAHEKVGDGNFTQFSKAVNREMAAAGGC